MANRNELLFIFAIVAVNLNSVRMVDDLNVSKRGDIDLKTCIDNFAVHKDKIIRTQDSRAMGAKYLNEVDLDTREECLRLCCETENCDVFVYEEKSVGSCYLFQCGPPEDFKCKFTHHVNYSSGVLTVNRHLPDLESQIKLTKHEEDLTKLRKPEIDTSGPQIAPEPKTTSPTTTTTTKRKESVDPAPNTKATAESKCSRFQFECRSNSECIAIYNACDGIPQCSDASDEAPELGCPDSLTTISTPINKPNIHAQQPAESPIPRLPISPPSQDVYRVTNQRQSLQVQTPPRQEDFIRPGSDPRGLLNSPGQYESPQAQMSQYNQYAQQPQPNWIARQSSQLLSQLPQYGDKNSHIFNHKESGLQVPDGSETSQPQPYNDMNNHEYPKIPSYYGDIYRQPMQQMPDNWPNNPDYRNVPYVPEMNANLRETWRQNIPAAPAQPPSEIQENQENANNAAQHDLPSSWKSDEKNPTHIQNKMAHELKQHSKEHQEEIKAITTAVEDKHIKIENHSHDHDFGHAKFVDGIAERLELQDGIAETPGGAILSLTLGLIITCLMAILIGCRLRVVRRRMRRSGKSYAHDADYLVNGMYL
ncbi:Low-density lipoprotein receptor domain class A [Popillia japonica]|uniref:Low-density lipoprotein receptor domain class A n=1 Tax=Popillia japonica TaxID=7064 RepID=A0AAW1N092_POPJA